MGICLRILSRPSISHLQERSSTSRLLHGGRMPVALCLHQEIQLSHNQYQVQMRDDVRPILQAVTCLQLAIL